jgi:hypothetical protein
LNSKVANAKPEINDVYMKAMEGKEERKTGEL